MLNGRRLVIDTLSEVYDLLGPWVDLEFWDFASHDPVPDSIYVLGRKQVVDNIDKFRNMSRDSRYIMVFGNSAEGSSTLTAQIRMLKLMDLVQDRRVLVISGGDMGEEYPYILHDYFFTKILQYPENLQVMDSPNKIFTKKNKPYKFFFLNGRIRPHRKYLWERFRLNGLLDSSLWTMLDNHMAGSRLFKLTENGRDLMDTPTPLRHLPNKYEIPRYHDKSRLDLSVPRQYIKHDMFNNEWGEIYLKPEPYEDTYFSIVTETIIDYPHSFRTEKMAKVLAMGHPWICASNRGFYRDLRNMGFRTFDHLIDERFDLIDNDQQRMDALVTVVEDLCGQDLDAFNAAAESVCKYNQQHLIEVAGNIQQEFPERFQQFIQRYRP